MCTQTNRRQSPNRRFLSHLVELYVVLKQRKKNPVFFGAGTTKMAVEKRKKKKKKNKIKKIKKLLLNYINNKMRFLACVIYGTWIVTPARETG